MVARDVAADRQRDIQPAAGDALYVLAAKQSVANLTTLLVGRLHARHRLGTRLSALADLLGHSWRRYPDESAVARPASQPGPADRAGRDAAGVADAALVSAGLPGPERGCARRPAHAAGTEVGPCVFAERAAPLRGLAAGCPVRSEHVAPASRLGAAPSEPGPPVARPARLSVSGNWHRRRVFPDPGSELRLTEPAQGHLAAVTATRTAARDARLVSICIVKFLRRSLVPGRNVAPARKFLLDGEQRAGTVRNRAADRSSSVCRRATS